VDRVENAEPSVIGLLLGILAIVVIVVVILAVVRRA
jgi:hypothetical protein